MKYFLNLFCWPGLLFLALAAYLPESLTQANQSAAPTGQAGSALRSLSGHGENFEVILKFPTFKTASDVSLTAYVLDSTTNEPIRGAVLSGDMSSGSESLAVTFAATPQSMPGGYEGKVHVSSDKPYSWLFDISLGEKIDLVAIDGFKAGEDSKGAPASASVKPKGTGYEIKLTPTRIAVYIVAFIVLQVAIIFIVRKRFTFNASAKDSR